MPESVELATILLTDLVGSTRLATTVGPVRADALREEQFGLLREAVASFGGNEFKNTGDGLAIAFGSASAAVECAVRMQQLFERRYRRSERPLHVRIGLGAGEVTVDEGDYFGMPAAEAARLCDRAPPDGILISSAVRMLAGRCEGVKFESIGAVELKGFAEPVECFAVVWSPLADEADGPARWPLPAVLRSVPTISFVGRQAERKVIEQARDAARDGARRIVLLSGEPGIGKTRLAAYAAHSARAEGFAVAWGRCSEELAVPYEPWIEACSQLVECVPEELLAGYVERHGGELTRLTGSLSRRVPGLPPPQSSDPDTERFLLFSAVAGLLRAVAGPVPLCLVLDDLHCADGQSVTLLKHVARSIDRGALQIILTYRDSELAKDHPLIPVLADLRRIEGVDRIALQGLGVADVAQMMSAAAGHELDEDGQALAAEIATETDGNPFFVEEILRNLWESGRLVFDEQTARWGVDRSTPIGLPESVRDVIARRVGRLGDDARELLTLAAVIGRSFDVELLAKLAELSEDRLLDQLEAAVAASLLAESTDRLGQFRFAHALINQTLYEALGATRRARVHRRVAEALEEVCGPNPGERLAELALHWRLATASLDPRKAAEYSRRAGRRALESLAPAEAVNLFTDAIELTGNVDSVERCEALIGLGEAQRQTGNAAYRETLLEASRIASALQRADLAANAALANNRGTVSAFGWVDEERVGAIRRAVELDDPPHPARRARLLALEAQELVWHPDVKHRRALASEAITLARQAAEPRMLADVLRRAFYALWSPETVELRVELAEEELLSANAARDPALRFWGHFNALAVAMEMGEFERAQRALEQMQLLARELDQPTLSWFATYSLAASAVVRGELAAGEQIAESAFKVGQEAGEPDAAMIYGAQLAYIRNHQGRGAEIVGMLEQGVASYPGIPVWRAGLAAVYCFLDRRTEAAAIVEQAAEDRFEHLPRDWTRPTALALYAEAASQTGDTSAARILYELIEPWADQVVWNGAIGYGSAHTWLGLLAAALGWDERADQHLAFACEFQEANGLLLWATRAHLGWGETLARRGDAARAREHGARALELTRAHGYGVFESRAAALVGAETTTQA